jgi:HSP20 family protein
MVDGVFDDVMRSALGTATTARRFTPEFDVRGTEDELLFIGDMPGMKREELEITLDGGVLTVKGERRFDSSKKEQVLLGRRYGQFSISYTLPDYVDGEKLSAELVDGVLTIRVPKQPKAKPRRIPIGTINGQNHDLPEK